MKTCSWLIVFLLACAPEASITTDRAKMQGTEEFLAAAQRLAEAPDQLDTKWAYESVGLLEDLSLVKQASSRNKDLQEKAVSVFSSLLTRDVPEKHWDEQYPRSLTAWERLRLDAAYALVGIDAPKARTLIVAFYRKSQCPAVWTRLARLLRESELGDIAELVPREMYLQRRDIILRETRLAKERIGKFRKQLEDGFTEEPENGALGPGCFLELKFRMAGVSSGFVPDVERQELAELLLKELSHKEAPGCVGETLGWRNPRVVYGEMVLSALEDMPPSQSIIDGLKEHLNRLQKDPQQEKFEGVTRRVSLLIARYGDVQVSVKGEGKSKIPH